jgi:hypothetical protein
MQVVVIDIDLKSKQGSSRNLGNGLEKTENIRKSGILGQVGVTACCLLELDDGGIRGGSNRWELRNNWWPGVVKLLLFEGGKLTHNSY